MITLRADRHFQRFEEIKPEILKAEKVELLLCDLDNTLRLRREKEPSEDLQKWVKECRAKKIKLVIISNNIKKNNLRHFCEKLNVPFVAFAMKPFRAELKKSIRRYNIKPEAVVMMGDKWTTDVLAAKFAGIRVWQVEKRRKVI